MSFCIGLQFVRKFPLDTVLHHSHELHTRTSSLHARGRAAKSRFRCCAVDSKCPLDPTRSLVAHGPGEHRRRGAMSPA